MREISNDLIKTHADRRFRSEYDYALFEYYRSAKVIAFLDRAGWPSTAASSTRDAAEAACRCRWPNTRGWSWASTPSIGSVQAGVDACTRAPRAESPFRCAPMAWRCHSATGCFDLVLSHAVIEHVADAPLYLRECRRVLAPGGRVYLSTAPYLSFAGAHLPRLRVPGAAASDGGTNESRFARFRSWPATRRGRCGNRRTRTRSSAMPAWASTNTTTCSRRCACTRLRGQIASAGLSVIREELHVTSTVRRLPARLGRWIRESPLVAGHADQ